MMKTILIVDDDIKILDLLKQYLESNGYTVITSSDGLYINQYLEKVSLIILDIMMPKLNGFDIIGNIRTKSDIPVIFLSAKSDISDKINGLELGANDYITKPFEPKELLLRIKNLIGKDKSFIKIGSIIYQPSKSILKTETEEIILSSTENAILKILANNINSPVKRETLSEMQLSLISERSIDVTINRIRKKLNKNQKYLQTIRHIGYMLTD